MHLTIWKHFHPREASYLPSVALHLFVAFPGRFWAIRHKRFSNTVAEIATSLLQYPSAVFSVLLENGQKGHVCSAHVLWALRWLIRNNPLYSEIVINDPALKNIEALEKQDSRSDSGSEQTVDATPSTKDLETCEVQEKALGTQGPIDCEALFHLSRSTVLGTEDLDNSRHSQMLIQHMLRPFSIEGTT